MPDGTYAHSCVAARVDVVCGAVNATAVAPRKARASFMIAVGACARSRRSVVGSRRSSVVASRLPSREVKFAVAADSAREQRAARCDGPQTAVRARSAHGHPYVPLRSPRASHGTMRALEQRNGKQSCAAFFARCFRSLVAVKLVQKGDEPLGTTNKAVRDSGTHGSWSMRCQQMREPCSAVGQRT